MPRTKSTLPKEPGKNIKISLSLHKMLKTVSVLSGQEMGVLIDTALRPWAIAERDRLFAAERSEDAQ